MTNQDPAGSDQDQEFDIPEEIVAAVRMRMLREGKLLLSKYRWDGMGGGQHGTIAAIRARKDESIIADSRRACVEEGLTQSQIDRAENLAMAMFGGSRFYDVEWRRDLLYNCGQPDEVLMAADRLATWIQETVEVKWLDAGIQCQKPLLEGMS
jgi:hypothetical protein